MPKDALRNEDRQAVLSAIEKAERNTSGEIRVHLENHCKGETLERALQIFEKLNMHKTTLRNGVLFYLAIKDHRFAIFGDEGINHRVPDNFWEDIREHMEAHFRQGRLAEGLVEGIEMAGKQLGQHFPFQSGDKNELPDDISFGK
ncbi:TPM domain-containing protein [Roseivirga sp. BDSF3-8]|uniref:TPM domain-containing protein n=1 Tax=Roseivirga sp. BDSF3-8 TaxID=3241598 RepID=UPI003531F4C1